jgi:hypothetical protein
MSTGRDLGTQLGDLESATIRLTDQVTILSEAVVDLRKLREQQNDLAEQQLATDQRARISLVHALDAADQVHTVDERVQALQDANKTAMHRVSNKTRGLLIVATILVASFAALQVSHHVETACPRPYDSHPLAKAACAIVLPGEPGAYPPGYVPPDREPIPEVTNASTTGGTAP